MKIVRTSINETSIYDNPSFEKKYLENIKKEARQNINDINPREIMSLLGKIMNIEAPHIDKLESIAKKIIMDYYGSILADVKLDIKIVSMDDEEKAKITKQIIDPDFFKKAKMKQKEKDKEDEKDIEKLQLEIHKRRVANIITQGESQNLISLVYLAKDELNKIYPGLPDMYIKLHEINDGLLWIDQIRWEEIIPQHPGPTNTSNVEWESEESEEGEDEEGEQEQTPIIKSRGLNFIVLLHETVKGVYELIFARGIPENQELANKVLSQADRLEHEQEDLAYGARIAAHIRDFMNTISGMDKYPNLKEYIYGEMIRMDAKEFIHLIQGILKKTDEAKNVIRKMLSDILREIGDWEYKSSMDKFTTEEPSEIEQKKKKEEKDYSKLNKTQLNNELNKALDNDDFETIRKITPYLKESLIYSLI